MLVGWLARQLTHQAANSKWNAANYKNVRAARCPSSYTARPIARRPLLVQMEYHPPGLDTTRPNAMYVLKRDEYVPCCCRRQLAVESMVRSVAEFSVSTYLGRYYELYWLVNRVIDERG